MRGVKVFLLGTLALVQLTSVLASPFTVFKRHFVPAGEVEATRPGRNSKLMDFVETSDAEAALPLSLSLESSSTPTTAEAGLEDKTVEQKKDFEKEKDDDNDESSSTEATVKAGLEEKAVEQKKDIKSEEDDDNDDEEDSELDDDDSDSDESVESSANFAENPEEAPKGTTDKMSDSLMENTDSNAGAAENENDVKAKDEDKTAHKETAPTDESIADESLIELENAVTEALINDLLAETASQQDRGGKETEDKVGLTGELTFPLSEQEDHVEQNNQREVSGIPAQNKFVSAQQAPNTFENTHQASNTFENTQQASNKFVRSPQEAGNSQVFNFKQQSAGGLGGYSAGGGGPGGYSAGGPVGYSSGGPGGYSAGGPGGYTAGGPGGYRSGYNPNEAQQQYPGQYQQQQQLDRRFGTAQARSNGLSSDFGASMGAEQSINPEDNQYSNHPQLDQREVGVRQSPDEPFPISTAAISESAVAGISESADGDVRCINKVMQVEETVYEERVKCQHSFTEKCHDTFITDYVATQEKKCETSFKKNCHITYKPMMFEEKVQVCNEPLQKVCSDETIGEEVCKTHYETVCETRFKDHEMEQDEPVCEMVIERQCNGVTVPIRPSDPVAQDQVGRRRRHVAALLGVHMARQRRQADGEFSSNDLNSEFNFLQSDLASIGESCEDWPVQKCRLEKRNVTKSNPETSCQKIAKEICAPSNCIFQKSDKVCRNESRSLVQNIPSEQCELEPQEDCKMETVLVPRLIQQPNCIKVPKEICVNAKTNPRKVKKPVIKEWCYRPSDLQSASSRQVLTQFFRQ